MEKHLILTDSEISLGAKYNRKLTLENLSIKDFSRDLISLDDIRKASFIMYHGELGTTILKYKYSIHFYFGIRKESAEMCNYREKEFKKLMKNLRV